MGELTFKALGNKRSEPTRQLETFPRARSRAKSRPGKRRGDEPVPGHGPAGLETVRIEFEPDAACIESKSLKLYLWSFRQEGMFCESFAARIATDIYEACKPKVGDRHDHPETAGGNHHRGNGELSRHGPVTWARGGTTPTLSRLVEAGLHG